MGLIAKLLKFQEKLNLVEISQIIIIVDMAHAQVMTFDPSMTIQI